MIYFMMQMLRTYKSRWEIAHCEMGVVWEDNVQPRVSMGTWSNVTPSSVTPCTRTVYLQNTCI